VPSIDIFKNIKDCSDTDLPKVTNFFVSFEWKMLNMLFVFHVIVTDPSKKSFFNVTIRIIFSQLGTGKKTGRNLVGLEKKKKSVKLSMTTFA
jgi:hypothetical protein